MLKIEDLKVALDADAGLVKAIDGLSLAIERGETFALVGESGCGKSMTALLRTAASPMAASASTAPTRWPCRRRACAPCVAARSA
jgi:ABC-type dipeptide/oligopeptide/nickel transport system ATPase component